jgi:hypothetical protein
VFSICDYFYQTCQCATKANRNLLLLHKQNFQLIHRTNKIAGLWAHFTSSGCDLRLFLLFRFTSSAPLGVRNSLPELSTWSMACVPTQSKNQAGKLAARSSFPRQELLMDQSKPQLALLCSRSTLINDNKFLLNEQESTEPTIARCTALRCWGQSSTVNSSFWETKCTRVSLATVDRWPHLAPTEGDGPNRKPQPWRRISYLIENPNHDEEFRH